MSKNQGYDTHKLRRPRLCIRGKELEVGSVSVTVVQIMLNGLLRHMLSQVLTLPNALLAIFQSFTTTLSEYSALIMGNGTTVLCAVVSRFNRFRGFD